MSFPGARWRCQLIARGRRRAAGWGPGSQLPARNYREKTRAAAALKLVIDPSAGPRSSLTAADPGRARGAGPPGTPRHPPTPAHPAVHWRSVDRPVLLSRPATAEVWAAGRLGKFEHPLSRRLLGCIMGLGSFLNLDPGRRLCPAEASLPGSCGNVYTIYFIVCIYLRSVWGWHMCVPVEVRGQLVGVGYLLPHSWSWG